MRYIFILSLTALIGLSACRQTITEEPDPIIIGKDAAITACQIALNDQSILDADITHDGLLTACLPEGLNYDDIDSVLIDISEGASITPCPSDITDWSVPVNFTVTSANGQTKGNYTTDFSIYTDSRNIFRIGNQTEMDEFAKSGLTKALSIMLYDDGSDDKITDLSGLAQIQTIETELIIRGLSVENITMPALEHAGSIEISQTTTNITDFPVLKAIHYDFNMTGNESVKTVSLPELESIGGSFTCMQNPMLESIISPSLSHLGYNYIIMESKIQDAKMIQGLKEIPGSLALYGELKSLEGFKVEKIGGLMQMSIPGVESLEPLSTLKEAEGIQINEGRKITSVDALKNISTNSISLVAFVQVKSIANLPIKEEMGEVFLKGFLEVTDLSVLSKLKRAHTLMLVELPKVPDLESLAGLEKVEYLALSLLESVENLPEFRNLTRIGLNLTITKLVNLKDLSGLENVTEVGELYIDNCFEMTSLKGLDNLEKIFNGIFVLANNKKLTSLEHLEKLKTIQIGDYDIINRLTIEKCEMLDHYCALKDLLIEKMEADPSKVSIKENKYNPTLQQLRNGECCPEGHAGA